MSERKRRFEDMGPAAPGGSGGGPAAAAPATVMASPTTNPYTGRPYSQRYHDILAKRLNLPVWQQRQASGGQRAAAAAGPVFRRRSGGDGRRVVGGTKARARLSYARSHRGPPRVAAGGGGRGACRNCVPCLTAIACRGRGRAGFPSFSPPIPRSAGAAPPVAAAARFAPGLCRLSLDPK